MPTQKYFDQILVYVNLYQHTKNQAIPFLVHFPNFWDKKKKFPEHSALSHTTSYGFLAPCQNLEKTNDTIPRKWLDRRKDGQKDGWKDRRKDRQTLTYRTLPATARGQGSNKVIQKIKYNFIGF